MDKGEIKEKEIYALSKLAKDEADFGRSVITEINEAAFMAFNRGQNKDNTVVVPIFFTVNRRRPIITEPPSPREVDVCYETTNSTRTYIQCLAEGVIPDFAAAGLRLAERLRQHQQRCEELWQEFATANSIFERSVVLRQLIIEGCIDIQRMMGDIERYRLP